MKEHSYSREERRGAAKLVYLTMAENVKDWLTNNSHNMYGMTMSESDYEDVDINDGALAHILTHKEKTGEESYDIVLRFNRSHTFAYMEVTSPVRVNVGKAALQKITAILAKRQSDCFCHRLDLDEKHLLAHADIDLMPYIENRLHLQSACEDLAERLQGIGSEEDAITMAEDVFRPCFAACAPGEEILEMLEESLVSLLQDVEDEVEETLQRSFAEKRRGDPEEAYDCDADEAEEYEDTEEASEDGEEEAEEAGGLGSLDPAEAARLKREFLESSYHDLFALLEGDKAGDGVSDSADEEDGETDGASEADETGEEEDTAAEADSATEEAEGGTGSVG